MKLTRHITRASALLAIAILTQTAMAKDADDKTLPFDRYSWVTTHNAFTSNGLFPNQSQTIAEQLDAGVRAFMLDLHPDDGRVRLCHNRCRGSSSEPFADFVNATLLPFLERSPDSIVTLHLEDFTDRDELLAELELAPALVGKTFDPYSWSTEAWPAYDEIVRRGQRILIFSLNRDQSGVFMTPRGAVHIMPSEDFTVENYWSLGTTTLWHDYRCHSRWGETRPLWRNDIESKPGWRPLFTMNQFHGLPSESHAPNDNSLAALQDRYANYCQPAAGRKPNYVAVDFHELGGVHAFVDWLDTQPEGPRHVGAAAP
ncbi:hypothetical protein ACQKIE_07070 [Luteibacter sp. NPDC031894]|uniref:hypothetical protein n=1 Tax=Luteibacter sp. NPDC031894 TaxID=3390572 RepID=UPI003CFFCDCB